MTKRSPNTLRSKSMLESMINRSPMFATTQDVAKLLVKFQISSDIRGYTQAKNHSNAIIAPRNLLLAVILSSIYKFIRTLREEATLNASLMDALKVIFIKAVSKSIIW